MKSLFLPLFLILSGLQLTAQVTFQPKQLSFEDKGVVYKKEMTFDFKLQTNGFSIATNFGKLRTYYLTTYYHIELGELKNIKEYRQQSFETNTISGLGSSNSFVFGKQNSFFVLRGGYGQKRYFSEKAKKQGLAIGMTYEGGPSLGLLKPYYLDLGYPIDNGPQMNIRSEKYSAQNHDIFLDRTRISGATGFTKGLSELSIIPGIHAQATAHFDWGAFDEFVKAIDAGIMVDFFFKKVPIMVEADNVENSPLFINLFLNLQLGKRW